MKLVHNIKISVFVRQGEDEQLIREHLLKLVPFSLEEQKLTLKRRKAVGFGERIIIIYELDLEKERHTNAFLESLREKLGGQQRAMLVAQENRLDDELFFYLRLDKQRLHQGEYLLTDGGECYHIRLSIAAFPKKKEVALEAVRKIFSP
ncbi:MAG: RNA-binding domain-containing protein [archaeon]